MIDLTELFKNPTFITILVSAIVLISGIIIYIGISRSKESRLQKQNTKELDALINESEVLNNKEETPLITIEDTNSSVQNTVIENNTVKPEVSEPIIIIDNEDKKEDVIETLSTEEKKEEKPAVVEEVKSDIVYAPIELNQDEAREELERLTKELEIRAELEKQKALENNDNDVQENEELTFFEKEQEENAIISLDELMEKANDIYQNNEVVQYEDEGNEPITLDDLKARWEQEQAKINAVTKEEKKEEVVVEVKPEEKEIKQVVFPTMDRITKFENSPIISPVYGIERKENELKEETISQVELELENTADYEKFDEEIRKTNEFIATLKELQKKLD
jgi:hypothetical protein